MAIIILALKSKGKVMEKVYLTAKQVRELMLKSETPKNRLYRLIKEAAQEEGCSGFCYWFNEYTDPQVRQKLIDDLTTDGYNVHLVFDEETEQELNAIEIYW